MTSNLRAETIYFDCLRRPFGRGISRDHRVRHKVVGVVVIHHFPGYDEATKEIVRKFAANGYTPSVSTSTIANLPMRVSTTRRPPREPVVGCRTINWSVTSARRQNTCARWRIRIRRSGSSATALGGDSQCSRRAV